MEVSYSTIIQDRPNGLKRSKELRLESLITIASLSSKKLLSVNPLLAISPLILTLVCLWKPEDVNRVVLQSQGNVKQLDIDGELPKKLSNYQGLYTTTTLAYV
ncbi:hypothetical protein K7X08_003888 [Anisodus acutangulus]|uniref:Uncharacterized protein n=1 Tax=Anisodus acutangulus TaxID=402998 RepID=A0A9Q1RJT8_9SOLA|nr:hypothetical protein K7X08_003888 [Anisodus acutangulus]